MLLHYLSYGSTGASETQAFLPVLQFIIPHYGRWVSNTITAVKIYYLVK